MAHCRTAVLIISFVDCGNVLQLFYLILRNWGEKLILHFEREMCHFSAAVGLLRRFEVELLSSLGSLWPLAGHRSKGDPLPKCAQLEEKPNLKSRGSTESREGAASSRGRRS